MKSSARIRLAKQRLGQINGVVHCAGVTRDASLRTQTFAESEAVWSTKVLGALVLDDATKHEDLDFFLLFSSLSALTGNIGQSAYAGANAWLDAWAEERARAVQAGTRSGRSLSIDWPLWSVGGLHPGRALADAMRRSFGLLELEAEEGMSAIDACFDTPGAQAVVFKGSDPDVRSALLQLAPPLPSRANRTRAVQVEAKAPDAAVGPAPMAIIGISGRYPQAPDLAIFWQNLCAGRDSITQIPGARWNVEQHFDARRNTPGKSYSKWGGFLDGVDQFDPCSSTLVRTRRSRWTRRSVYFSNAPGPLWRMPATRARWRKIRSPVASDASGYSWARCGTSTRCSR